jgi:hypothetical protein
MKKHTARSPRANSRIWLALAGSGWLWVLSKSCSTRRARYNSRRTVVLRADARGITVEEPSFCREQPGAARSSQKQPGAARSSQGLPGEASSSQELPGAARSSQKQPGAARSSRAWLALCGSEWLCVALGGSGWLWLALAGSGWLWLAPFSLFFYGFLCFSMVFQCFSMVLLSSLRKVGHRGNPRSNRQLTLQGIILYEA